MKMSWNTKRIPKSGATNLNHLPAGAPIRPEIRNMPFGQNILEKPSPNWNARTAVWRETPIISARGAIIGITADA